MALSATILGSLIDGELLSQGATGIKRTIFSNAIASGIVTYMKTVSFTTVDVGVGSGGNGTGTGITGLSSATMVSFALSAMSSTGSKAAPLMAAIMEAVVLHLGQATLTSSDPGVGSGSGTITPGNIAVVTSNMAAAIVSALEESGAKGNKRSDLANAIATGICTDILASGVGTVTISGGSGTSPSAGSGNGTIS